MKTMMIRFVLLLLPLTVMAAGGGSYPSAQTNVTNKASLQRGAKLFVNYCLSCHSAKYMRYKRLVTDLGLSEAQVNEYLIFTGAKLGETMDVAMSPEDAEAWFGKAPPDLSVIARSRGVDWLAAYMKSFYLDPSRPSGWNNTVFPNASMPNVMADRQGTQIAVGSMEDDGHGGEHEVLHLEKVSEGSRTDQEFEQDVRDLVSFMEYMGDPSVLERKSMGAYVFLFLAFFAFLTYIWKLEYWKEIH